MTKERAGITDRGGSEGRRTGRGETPRHVRTRACPKVRAEALRMRRDRGWSRTGSEVRGEILQMMGAPGESPPPSALGSCRWESHQMKPSGTSGLSACPRTTGTLGHFPLRFVHLCPVRPALTGPVWKADPPPPHIPSQG